MASQQALLEQVSAIATFTADLHTLMSVFDKSRPTIMPAGSAVNIYKEGTALSPSAAAKGALISVDGAVPVLDKTVSLTWDKRREIAPFEDIQVQGYEICVGGTADTLVKRSAAVVRTSICNAIKAGTGSASEGATVQQAVANAHAALINGTADESGSVILFCNPTTWASYAGSASISTQTAMGITYVKNFMGIGDMLILPGLDNNKIYATTKENVGIYAASIGTIADVYTDADGVIGISIVEKPENAGIQVCVYNGVQSFLKVLAKCYIAEVDPS